MVHSPKDVIVPSPNGLNVASAGTSVEVPAHHGGTTNDPFNPSLANGRMWFVFDAW